MEDPSRMDRVREAAASLSPLDYTVTFALLAIYVVGTSLDDGPATSMDFLAVAIQGRVLELSSKIDFRRPSSVLSDSRSGMTRTMRTTDQAT